MWAHLQAATWADCTRASRVVAVQTVQPVQSFSCLESRQALAEDFLTYKCSLGEVRRQIALCNQAQGTSISANFRCNSGECASASCQLQETSIVGIAFELHEAEAGGRDLVKI